MEVALSSTERPEPGSGIRDAGLCHGAAGLGRELGAHDQARGVAQQMMQRDRPKA